jgi:hypothetical protein
MKYSLMRRRDSILLYSIVETSQPRSVPCGHSYNIDFMKKENSPDWNKEEIDQLRGEMESMISKSRVSREINFEVRHLHQWDNCSEIEIRVNRVLDLLEISSKMVFNVSVLLRT